MSSKGLVLVTGANGYIAARTLEAFLQAGYSVRGTVRSRSSATSIVKALAQYGDKLQIVEVPDITVEGAFDEAVKGVDAIAHLAAPVSFFFTDPEPVMNGAIHGVSRILESANKEASVKNFVFMSSIAAVFWRKDVDYTFTESDWNNEAEKMVADKGKDAPSPVIYSASKAAAEKAFWKFREEHHPHFSMSAINPCFVAGPSLVSAETPEKISETIGFVWRALTGESLDQITLSGGFAGYVDVRDVARLVVFNVDHPEKTDGERYIAASAYGPPQAVVDILRKAYPERADIIVKGNPGEGYRPDYKFPAQMAFDGTKAVRTTGQEYIPFEKTVLDTAEGLKHLL